MTLGSGRFDVVRIRLAIFIGLLSVVLLAINALADSSGEPVGLKAGSEVQTLPEYDLLARAGMIAPQPYWVGRREGEEEFEVERDSEGNLFVRYLTGSERDPRSESLTVATYPVSEARRRLERVARSKGGSVSRGEDFYVFDSPGSFSTYVVFDELPELQVEVFSPQPGAAARFVESGRLTPLHWTPLD
jgi:hypothetical protein